MTNLSQIVLTDTHIKVELRLNDKMTIHEFQKVIIPVEKRTKTAKCAMVVDGKVKKFSRHSAMYTNAHRQAKLQRLTAEHPHMEITLDKVEAIFNELNAKHFAGSLKATFKLYKNIGRGSFGNCSHKNEIGINNIPVMFSKETEWSDNGESALRHTILHEMVHAEMNTIKMDGVVHNELFITRMKELDIAEFGHITKSTERFHPHHAEEDKLAEYETKFKAHYASKITA